MPSFVPAIARFLVSLRSVGDRFFRAARLRRAAVLLAGAMLVAFSSLGGGVIHAQQTCPCSIWSTSTTPGPMDSESTALELGVKFTADVNGSITGLRFYKYAQNTGTHVGNLWSSTGTLMGTVTFANETASGWQQALFAAPIAITANTTYVASYHTDTGHYAANSPNLAVAVDNAPLHALASGSSGGNGVYAVSATSVFPTNSFNAANYWVDVVFTSGSDTTPPTVTGVTPASGATGVATTTAVTATFSEAMLASSITNATVVLKDSLNTTVAATVAYNATTATATLTPNAALAYSTTYTVTVKSGAGGVKDAAGNALASDFSWSFTTSAPQVCPCSIWSTSTTPGPMDGENAALELGVKFTADANGFITGLRFYKYAQNTGTHIGNLWSSTGTLMGTVTFANESASGWQQQDFAAPVPIAANTTYVASYHTDTGHYAANSPNLTVAVDNPPLHALASGSSGGNGVYAVSSTSVFPTNSFNAANYWVDVVFTAGGGDTMPPTVTGITPASGATGVATNTTVTATFSEAMTASTITTSTVVLKDPSNATVAASVAYNAGTLTATLTPTAALANSTTYTATVVGGGSGVKDAAGNALASNFSWSSTTVADTTPPTVTGVTPANGATGVVISTSVTATFSEAMNAATITTSTVVLKDASNATVPATVTYNSSTLKATLIPNAVLAYSTTYTATITGGASGVKDSAGNALASNFSWSFTTAADTTPPIVTGVTPASGATGLAVLTTVTATFSESMTVSTINTSTVILKDAGNLTISATVTYNAATFTATLTPSVPLSYSTAYTATVKSGASGVKDAAGNALASDFTWTFTTMAPPYACPCSVWTTSTTPGPADDETASLELGMKFRADIGGYVTGVRFYKYAQNTGTHLGNLWSSTGTLLATVTFTNETASGWQQATFAPPVTINANTTYVISYHTNTGRYAATTNAFTNAVDNAPLHVLSSGSSGGNGVYAVGASAFPTQTWNAANYWVDVVFSLNADVTPPTVTSVSPANGSTFVPLASPVTATFSEAMNGTTINASTFVLKAGSTVIPATVSYDGASQTAILTPGSPLAFLTVYTATLTGGSSGVKDVVGNALASDYSWSFTTTPDTSGPKIVLANPVSGSTSVPINQQIEITFDKLLTPSTATTGITLRDASNALVAGTVTYDATTRMATLTPAAWLAKSATYTVKVQGGSSGVKDNNGYGMPADVTWSFTTGAAACPCSLWTLSTPVGPMASDAATQELGIRFQADVAGSIAGLRFYKHAPNVGTHVGHLWTSTGTLLGTVTFSNETASGWQQAMFASPIAVTANTTYVASYHTDSGFYANTTNGLAANFDNAPLHALANGGVFVTGAGALFPNQSFQSTNYWVDVVFTTSAADTAPPWVTGTAPADNSLGVSTVTTVVATFSEPVDVTTVTTGNFTLRTSNNTLVSATVTYDATNWIATLTPASALASGSTYTATVNGIKDTAGNTMTVPANWAFTTAPATLAPTQGAGGPILVVTSTSNPFSQYYPEILRAEGFNEFNVLALTSVTASVLASYDVVILGEQTLTAAQVTTFTNWVQGGGNLIAFRPDKKLAALLGLSTLTTTSSNVYMGIDTSQAPGTGIVGQTMQFHGTADQYTLAGARAVATIYSDASNPTAFPAVTLVTSGAGQAAAFTYDLAKSIIYTRQGNPAWAGTERDGNTPIRSDDLFFGAKTGDVQPDWVDFNNIQIPQADEQQRLLANLILLMNADRKPLPRFWYLPQGRKAAVVMTGDDHGYSTTTLPTRFSGYVNQSPSTCTLDNWECIRATTYIFPNTPLTNGQASTWLAQGFEVAMHGTMDLTNVNCGSNFTASTLASNLTSELSQFATKFPSVPSPVTHRQHCIMWSDWSSMPTTELTKGMRLDTGYYYWPAAWILDRPGLFTGTGMPMRFATTTGSMIDVYQATTQMTDESGQTYPLHINTLLDNALGATGYYGVFTANIHSDATSSQPMADSIVNSAKTRGVAIVSSQQMLTWLDGRNSSAFGAIGWAGNALTFNVLAGNGSNGLQMMIPTQFGTQTLTGITLNAAPVTYTTQTIKGVTYAFVTVAAGQYVATYTAP